MSNKKGNVNLKDLKDIALQITKLREEVEEQLRKTQTLTVEDVKSLFATYETD